MDLSSSVFIFKKKKQSSFTRPCNVLSMFLKFEPYVLIWFVLIKKRVEVLGNKVIDEEEDISHEEEENSEILVPDGDDDHTPVINIYELLMNSEFIEIQTDRDD